MIVITERFGQFGNRLYRYARALALADRLGCRVLDLSMYEYAHCFEPKPDYERRVFGLLKSLLTTGRFPFVANLVCRIVPGIVPRLSEYVHKNIENYHVGIPVGPLAESLQAKGKRALIAERYGYFLSTEDPKALLPRLREIFPLASKYDATADKLLSDRQADIRVGVHIRRGDYAGFWDGKWYFPFELYRTSMEATDAIFASSGKRVRFVIVSDETVPVEEHFAGLPVDYYGPQHLATDMALLSRCQYLLASLSTFSGWTSYFWQIPRFVITPENPSPTLDSFQIAALN